MKGRKRTLKYWIIGLITFLSAMLMVMDILLDKIDYVKLPESDEELGIKNDEFHDNTQDGVQENTPQNNSPIKDNVVKEEVKKEGNRHSINGPVRNIVLFGGDRRYSRQNSRTDTIIVLSIDTEHKKIKMSSIMRDTYVRVYGHGMTKLSHAYFYGGPALTIRTINENFNLNIRDYIFIDFYGFEKLIDSIDGIEVDIKQPEISEINKYVREIACLTRKKPRYIMKQGIQILNGQQAVAYCRIRKSGNGDFERTERQRAVLERIIRKVSISGPLKLPIVAANTLQYVETSIPKKDIIQLGTYILTSDIKTIEQRRFPVDGCWKGKYIGTVWYIVPQMNTLKKQIHQFIYEDKPIH